MLAEPACTWPPLGSAGPAAALAAAASPPNIVAQNRVRLRDDVSPPDGRRADATLAREPVARGAELCGMVIAPPACRYCTAKPART